MHARTYQVAGRPVYDVPAATCIGRRITPGAVRGHEALLVSFASFLPVFSRAHARTFNSYPHAAWMTG
jgi:hypothetical protein